MFIIFMALQIFQHRQGKKIILHSPFSILNSRKGYVFLLAILFVGAIVTGVSMAMILLGTSAFKSGQSLERSALAYQLARNCAERAIFSLRSDLGYAGNESFAYSYGTCNIMTIAAGGNYYRTLCVYGTADTVVRKFEITLAQVLFSTKVHSWNEVTTITKCS